MNWVVNLLKKRAFLSIVTTQFFGAFNDNAFKLSMLTLISYYLSQSEAQSEQYQAIASALFMLPFLLFSATAGQMADQWNKATLCRIIKWFELGLMCLGSFALYHGHLYLLLLTLTGMGIHSTFFGPIKYSILPDLLPNKELLGATSLVESTTFIAILLGTLFGTMSISGVGHGVWGAAFLLVLNAAIGLIASYYIPRTLPKANALNIDWNIFRATFRLVKTIGWFESSHKDPGCTYFESRHAQIVLTIYAITWFWVIGTVVIIKFPDYTHFVLGAEPSVFATFLACFSVGIALGSLCIKLILKNNMSLRYVPWTMFLLSIFSCDLFLASPSAAMSGPLESMRVFFSHAASYRLVFDLFMLAFSSGLFIVPLYTYLQIKSDESSRSCTIAVNNIMNAIFMVLASLFVMLLSHFRVTIPAVFLILSALNAVLAIALWFVLDPRPCG